MIARRQRRGHAGSIVDELQRRNHSKEPVAQRVALILTVRGVPRCVTCLPGMQRIARLARRGKINSNTVRDIWATRRKKLFICAPRKVILQIKEALNPASA